MYAIDYMIESGLKKTESRLFKSWNKILKGQINADIVVLGNSRAYRHFNPQKISAILGETVWNLGMDAYPFNIQKMKFDIYRKNNIKPKLLLINVDHSTLKYIEIYYEREQFLPYLDNISFQNKYIHKAFSNKEREIPLVRYFGYRHEIAIGFAEYFHLHHYNDNENNGFWEMPEQWDENELERLINNQKAIKMTNDEKTVIEFKNFITKNLADNINIVLVWSPLHKKALQVLKNNKKERSYFKQLAAELHANFLDYSDDEICDDTTYFANTSHLNKKGAELFSIKLANDLKKLSK